MASVIALDAMGSDRAPKPEIEGALQVARQGILIGIGVSVVLMIFATAGWIPPAMGALFQELLDLATILNALRAR